MGEAITGAIVPGLVIILGGLLSGVFGKPLPTSLPSSPTGNSEDTDRAASEAAAKAEAERQAAWVKQREEDLRQVREQKSFIAATAAGARQGGFDAGEHDRQMADLERRERELTRQIQNAGGDSSYVAKERETIKVGKASTKPIVSRRNLHASKPRRLHVPDWRNWKRPASRPNVITTGT